MFAVGGGVSEDGFCLVCLVVAFFEDGVEVGDDQFAYCGEGSSGSVMVAQWSSKSCSAWRAWIATKVQPFFRAWRPRQ